MERKIGEIFEYNGKWYQCVEGSWCRRCDFHRTNLSASQCDYRLYCLSSKRKDGKSVIFKKLEKVGGLGSAIQNGVIVELYKTYIRPILPPNVGCILNDYLIVIEIKNKEDMKTVKISKEDLDFLINKIRYGILPKHIDYDKITNEISKLFSVEDTKHSNSENIGKNLKPFDLEAAKSGKPVCTRDGRKARIICFDSKNDPQRPIIALVENNSNELLYEYTIKGKDRFSHISTTGTSDLMMLPEKKEGWVNVYKETSGEYYMDKIIHKTEKFAFDVACPDDYIGTVKIEWYE